MFTSSRQLCRVFLFVVAFIFGIGAARLNADSPTGFVSLTVDHGRLGADDSIGSENAMALVNGRPAVAFFDQTSRRVMFARNTAVDGSGTWDISTIADAGTAGQWVALAVINGNPAVCYYDNVATKLIFVRATDTDGFGWGTTSTIVDATLTAGAYASMTVVNGVPAISYQGPEGLKFVRAKDMAGGTWNAAITVDASGGAYTSLAIVNGTPAISYKGANDLKFVRASDASGTAWGTPIEVDASGGDFTSLSVIAGVPTISYAASGIKFVRASDAAGASWEAPITVVAGATVTSPSMVLVAGWPAISFRAEGNSGLGFVRATDGAGASWGTPVTVEARAGVGAYNSLVVVDGRPAISYLEEITNGGLLFVRAADATGSAWGAAAAVDSGSRYDGDTGYFGSLAVADGFPAIAYYSTAGPVGDLMFVRATNLEGTAWGNPIKIDSSIRVSFQISLAIVDGCPAIAYDGLASSSGIKYVRAQDPAGAAWGTPIVLESGGITGQMASLTVINGFPAVSYVNGSAARFIRATDSTGAHWGTPISIGSTISGPNGTSLAVVAGTPAVAYMESNKSLRFVRALDASGSAWGSPTAIDSLGADLGNSSVTLVVADGRPAISYHKSSTRELKYVRANDTLGNAWGAPVAVSAPSDWGMHAAMTLINGVPVAAYFDFNTYDLKIARAKDVSGSEWNPVEAVDTQGIVGDYPSLAMVNGDLAVSYNRSSWSPGGGLRFGYLPLAAQSIGTLPAGTHTVMDGSIAMIKSASSGLPLNFAVSGPATMTDGTLSFTGLPGVVTITATQAGNAYYKPAAATTSFEVVVSSPQLFFGSVAVGGSATDDVFSIAFAADRKSGTLIYLNKTTGEASVVTFNVKDDGSFEIGLPASAGKQIVTVDGETRTVAAAAVARTFRGRFQGFTITGSIPEIGGTFTTMIEQPFGSTVSLAGVYRSDAVNAASGSALTMVGVDGRVLMAVTRAGTTTGGSGTMAASGKFFVVVPTGLKVDGVIDTGSGTVSGTIGDTTKPNQPAIAFAGLTNGAAQSRRLVNLSSRVRVAPGDNRTLIVGFVVNGTNPKKILLRGVGPTLRNFAVSDALANPRLKLFDDGGRQIMENDDWSGSDAAAAVPRVGAFALPTGSRDAALLATLNPGRYTMHLPGDSDTGVVLAEIYDADETPDESQRLINISSRAFVESGEGILIGGFAVKGNVPKRVLIRGVGPGLAPYGVSDALLDPKLAVFSGQTLVAQNNDWETGQPLDANQGVATAADIASASQQTGAFGLVSGSKDAALLITLAPGSYTAQVSSTTGGTGTALVEIYELPQ